MSKSEEEAFSKLIEKPIGILKSKVNSKSIDNYEIYRAAFLYFFFQIERFKLNIGLVGEGWALKDLLKMSEIELNTISEKLRESFNLYTLDVIEGHALFFPEFGLFTFPVIGQSPQYSYNSFALPINPFIALCLIPKGPSEDEIKLSRNILMSFSIGLNESCNKILIPPQLSDRDEVFLIDKIKEFRSQATSHQEQCNKLNNLVEKMYSTVGLKFRDVFPFSPKK